MSETPKPWAANTWPTAEQLADWLARCTEQERLDFASAALRDGARAARCMVDHRQHFSGTTCSSISACR